MKLINLHYTVNVRSLKSPVPFNASLNVEIFPRFFIPTVKEE